MHIAVSPSRKEDASEAVHEAFQDLRSGLDGPLDLIFAYYSHMSAEECGVDALIDHADEALLQAKKRGKNRIVLSSCRENDRCT